MPGAHEPRCLGGMCRHTLCARADGKFGVTGSKNERSRGSATAGASARAATHQWRTATASIPGDGLSLSAGGAADARAPPSSARRARRGVPAAVPAAAAPAAARSAAASRFDWHTFLTIEERQAVARACARVHGVVPRTTSSSRCAAPEVARPPGAGAPRRASRARGFARGGPRAR